MLSDDAAVYLLLFCVRIAAFNDRYVVVVGDVGVGCCCVFPFPFVLFVQ